MLRTIFKHVILPCRDVSCPLLMQSSGINMPTEHHGHS